MEKMKKEATSIKSSFIAAIMVTLFSIFSFSAITLYGCWRVQKYLLPDSNEVWLQTETTYADGKVSEMKQRMQLDTPAEISALVPEGEQSPTEKQVEYTIEMIESSYSMLSPKRKVLYRGTQIVMAVFPLIYSVAGISVCALWFYRKKIAPPVQILTDAVIYIQNNSLDFQIEPPSKDELGQLCSMFEIMRQTLYENNRQLWRTIEDQRLLQASVAHDLRNPIAIIEGYIEYMQKNLSNKNISDEKLAHILSNMSTTAKRLEQYTDCMRSLNALEEMEVKWTPLSYPKELEQIVDGLSMIFQGRKLSVDTAYEGNQCTIFLDPVLLARILENILTNSIRYANKEINIACSIKEDKLSVFIMDDGTGFSDNLLRKKITLFHSEDSSGSHLGLGLATARILCQKQGGNLFLSNRQTGGACVQIVLPTKTKPED